MSSANIDLAQVNLNAPEIKGIRHPILHGLQDVTDQPIGGTLPKVNEDIILYGQQS